MLNKLWKLGQGWHRLVAQAPRPIAQVYLSALGGLARAMPHQLALHMQNAALGTNAFSSDLRFRPRRVTVGSRTPIRLVPHIGEFDAACLFTRRLEYEQTVFSWLEAHAADYDLVIEIGANVGVFTVFLDRLEARGPRRICAFEPAAEPYRRLCRNLAVNSTSRVTAYPAAVGERSGFVPFYEPAGHLTNGSFVRDFAAIFSEDIRESRVLCCSAGELGELVCPGERVLLKIDVEGYEPTLLRCLAPFIEAHRPDLLIEILQETCEQLQASPVLARHERFLIADEVRPHPKLFYDPQHRDWLLQPRT